MKDNELMKVVCGIKQIEETFNCNMGELIYTLKQANTIWYRCPFIVGDRVSLNKTPDIGPDSGWRGGKHFLVKGSVATVVDRDFHDGMFHFGLEFDDETWIDLYGNKNTPDRKGIYYFGEKSIERLIS